jgi:hypothetical protein
VPLAPGLMCVCVLVAVKLNIQLASVLDAGGKQEVTNSLANCNYTTDR